VSRASPKPSSDSHDTSWQPKENDILSANSSSPPYKLVKEQGIPTLLGAKSCSSVSGI